MAEPRWQPAANALAVLPDDEVVRRVVAGETALFEVLMRRYNQRVYRAVRAILREESEVEDAMQEAYVAAFEHLGDFNGDSSFATWLTRIAVNEALGRIRRRGRSARWLAAAGQESEEEMAFAGTPPRGPEDAAAGREMTRLLEAAIDELPPLYRAAFMLREVEQLSTAEAAGALGVTEEALKVRLHRARLALRDALFERMGGAASQAFPFGASRCDAMVAAVLARIGGLPAGG